VQDRFARYGLLDDQVRFLPGWFHDTLPAVAGRTWSVIRLDGDFYSSTTDALVNLYPGLSPGGFCIIDDWGAVEECRDAVRAYREGNGIDEPVVPIDWTGVYWRKAY